LPSTECQVCQVLTTTSWFLHPLSRSSARGAAVINSTVDISLSWTHPRRPLATGMQRAARAHPTPLSSVASPTFKSRCGTRRQARARDSPRTSVWYPSLAHCVEPWSVMLLQSATMSTKATQELVMRGVLHGHAWRGHSQGTCFVVVACVSTVLPQLAVMASQGVAAFCSGLLLTCPR
jgi:hypothetical protein